MRAPGTTPASPPDTDEALALRAASGDRPAFAALVARYEHRLYRFALVRLRSEHDACEVAQETLLRAWKAAPAYRASAPYASWILSIAHHEIVNVTRRRTRDRNPPDRRAHPARNDEPPSASDVWDEANSGPPPDVWRAAREALEAHVFEIVWLRYAEDLEPREIARVTGRTPVGVRVILHRARARIAEALGAQLPESNAGPDAPGDDS